ncbi:hypothetical protein RUMCAL_01386 [Ruminococcus callidus ATCC 27760]|jgi:hypothetical protein|uniref:Uncharacterized protein n=1 Tax=Ruminococcus callidus ATCC 27760 TaxID=411473 RepID=U2KCJ3_9FIRM|nr:hypothetical protein RUMCAL_01386 [Ruminococcus callidus ATCC 27760]
MIAVYGAAFAVPHGCHHKTTNTKEGQIKKAIPSLYKRREREAKGVTSYE